MVTGFEVLLPVGLGVVKLALRLNKHSGPAFADAVEDVEGLFGTVRNVFEKRKLVRNTQDIVDEITKHLENQIQIEFRSLSDADIRAAVGEVVELVDNALPLAAECRVEIIKSANPATELLARFPLENTQQRWTSRHGDSVARLAVLLLREVSHATVVILRKHPDLNMDMLVTLVRSSEDAARFFEEVRAALRDLPARSIQAGLVHSAWESERDHRNYTLEYLRSVASDYDTVGLYGLDMDWRVVHYSLNTSYVKLRLSGQDRQPGASTFEEALSSPGVSYLRGPAGSGKTTILQWLAVNLARNDLPGDYRKLFGRVPFVVKLRNFADTELPPVKDLASLTVPNNLVAQPTDWMSRVVKDGAGAILLVDGVDEFPDSRKTDLVDWLHSTFHALGDPVVVITGRGGADTAVAHLSAAFSDTWNEFDIQPMDRNEIRSFVLHWHKATKPEARSATHVEDALKVADALSNSREYRQLSTTPLLCAALCALFYVKHGTMPSSRIDVYKTLIRLLLEQRDSERHIGVDQIPLDLHQKQLLLEEIATFMLANSLSELTFDRALDCVARALLLVPGELDAEIVLGSLLRRSGLLRTPAIGIVDFVHRTFLEYLAAEAYVRHDSIEALAKDADKQNWAETAVLAGSLANDSQYKTLVNIVARDGTLPTAGPTVWLSGLAAGLLRTRRSKVPDVDTILEDILRHSLPPQNEEQVRAIVAGGESLFPLLIESVLKIQYESKDSRKFIEMLGAAVRALGSHGSFAALAAMKQIPAQVRLLILSDLLAIWTWFDLAEFCEALLEDLRPKERTVAVARTSVVFPYFPRLSRSFDWEAIIEYPEESLVADCKGARISRVWIRHLDAAIDSAAQSCEFLDGLIEPRVVKLESAKSFLLKNEGRNFEKLENLSVSFASGQMDLSFVGNAAILRTLEISGDVLLVGAANNSSADKPAPLLDTVFIRDRVKAHSGVSIRARRASLRNADAEILEVVVSDVVDHVELIEIAGLRDLEPLLEAAAITILRILDCRSLEDLSSVLQMESLRSFSILGSNQVDDAGVLVAITEAIDETTFGPDLQTIMGRDDQLSFVGLSDSQFDVNYVESLSFDAYDSTTQISSADQLDFDVDSRLWVTGDEGPSEAELEGIQSEESL